jgi:hypothetical protein
MFRPFSHSHLMQPIASRTTLRVSGKAGACTNGVAHCRWDLSVQVNGGEESGMTVVQDVCQTMSK